MSLGKIFILEDDETIRHLLISMLQKAGYEVVGSASHGGRVREAIEKNADVVLIDIHLNGGTSGIEAAKILKKSRIPFIYVTAATDDHTIAEAKTTDPYGYLMKPITPVALKAALEIALYRRKMELKLAEKDEQLKQVQRMESIGRFAGGMAHEFNSLLTVIIGYSKFAQRQIGQTSPALESLMEIDKAARKAAHLTKQILAFSDHQIFDVKPTPVNDLLNDFASFIRPLLGERYSVELRNSDVDLRPCLDSGEIEQALTHIVINASEAMPGGGKISIEAVVLNEAPPQVPFPIPVDQWLQISIGDTGIGIDPEIATRIFDPFFTTKTAGQGHGLGLAIAYGIVRQHDGWIDADSTPGHGSTFHIFLPVRIDCVPSTLAETPGSVHRGETILIAEDTELLKKMLKTILADMGYDVLTASDGVEAIDLYRQNKDRVRLMMLDMVMPKKGGREVYETLAEEARGVKFLMTSGYTSDDSIRNFTQRHGVPLIPKPYDPEELGKKIQQLLEVN